MSSRRETGQLVKELRRAGFRVTRTGSGHWKVQSRDGRGSVIMAFSPSSSAQHKTMRRLQEIGYEPRS